MNFAHFEPGSLVTGKGSDHWGRVGRVPESSSTINSYIFIEWKNGDVERVKRASLKAYVPVDDAWSIIDDEDWHDPPTRSGQDDGVKFSRGVHISPTLI